MTPSALQTLARQNRDFETNTRTKYFWETARYFAMGNGVWSEALKLAKEYRAALPVVDAIKAAVDAGTTSNLSALAPYRQLSDAFVLSLRQFSCFDRMLPFFRAVPVHQQIAVISGGATAATVGEAAPVPVASLQFTLVQVQEQKTICIAMLARKSFAKNYRRAKPKRQPAKLPITGNQSTHASMQADWQQKTT